MMSPSPGHVGEVLGMRLQFIHKPQACTYTYNRLDKSVHVSGRLMQIIHIGKCRIPTNFVPCRPDRGLYSAAQPTHALKYVIYRIYNT